MVILHSDKFEFKFNWKVKIYFGLHSQFFKLDIYS